jgi:heterodisulfide reductase subunit C
MYLRLIGDENYIKNIAQSGNMDTQKAVEHLKQIVKPEQILTDPEDLYVYSFEKIFEEQNPVPDMVVKTLSSEEAQKILELAEKGCFTVVKRGEMIARQRVEKPFLLLDDTPTPELKMVSSKKVKIIEVLKGIRESGYGNPRNLAFALKTLFLEKNPAKCEECKTCSGYCTVASSFEGVETWSSKGRAIVIRGLQSKELPVSKRVVDLLYTCTECGLCFAQCFEDLEVNEAILATRHQIAEKGMVPEVFREAAENIIEVGDPGAVPVKRRLSWMQDFAFQPLPRKTEVLYWVGCMVADRTPKTARAFLKILNHANVSFSLGKGRAAVDMSYCQQGSGMKRRKLLKRYSQK